MATPEDARRANRSLLLRALHADGPLSRADLAKLAGLTRATVSAVVRELLDDGVVEELGLSTAGGVGKPATLVDIAADGRHILCVDLSEPSRFVGAIVNLAGKVVVRRTYDRKDKTGKAAVTLLRRICKELVGDAERPLLGAGIASPGIVDADGVVATAAHLGWTDLPLGAALTAELGIPVVVVNDANAAAVAELTYGGASGNLICVRVDEGVGAGLVLDGRLFTGSSYAAGEIGHVVVVPDGSRCACGKHGCLETEVSAPLLASRLEAAAAGDGSAVLSRAGEHLGTALATVLSALDVTDVVLSGSGAVTTETFRAAAVRAIAARTMPQLADRLVVRAGTFGFDDVLVGAAAMVLDHELGIR